MAQVDVHHAFGVEAKQDREVLRSSLAFMPTMYYLPPARKEENILYAPE